MQKIISLFARNYEGDRLVRDELVPGAEWVAAGEGVATVKWDGAACLIANDRDDHGPLWRRYDAKKGKQPPPGFVPAQEPDPTTGHYPGWIPCVLGTPADQWFMEALANSVSRSPLPAGTYEAVGPHFQGNPYGFPRELLIRHGNDVLPDAPREFGALRIYLATAGYPTWGSESLTATFGPFSRSLPLEGIVWHHRDGRMVKIKAKDFGIPWPPRAAEST